MPTDTRSLAWWIHELVEALEKEPATAVRIRQVVGQHRARITLDDDSVIVGFDGAGQLLVRPDDAAIQVDGEGSSTRAEICAILDARSDPSQAVISGRVSVLGPTAAVAAMLHAIEILLDGAARLPRLRQLAGDFVAVGPRPTTAPPAEEHAALAEMEVLRSLDLLP
jgi:hypothetical protein